ncbi:MAG TPA: methionine--tRNA ligase [Candidatus Paceibacterota bacterium]|nr:methionine--tRNA ligase [Candidatus Paceibacterota bacterium]
MNNKNNKSFYITTTLPYVNSKPHIGFAVEITRADVVARHKRLCGYNVFFNTGTDEHGQKIFQKAQEEKKEVQQFVDEKVLGFTKLCEKLNIKYDRFIRTTDTDHVLSAQKFWKKCDENGFIYKKNYRGLYCVGCEMFLTEKDLVNGRCPYHPDKVPEEIEEENYFFKYSAFTEKLLEIYKNKKDFVIPQSRLKEISNFAAGGLEDFSISRIKEKMPWGIPVPGDDQHVMYVWFDALVNYISTLGWPDNLENFKKFWENGTPVQYCGKDNLQFQSARWQAMLLSVGLPSSDKIIINGFITSNGQKMSKSLGNVIDPLEIIDEYGTDALRYYLIRELNSFEDSDFTIEKFKESYNANLANGLGNLVSRVMKMSEDNLSKEDTVFEENIDFANQLPPEYKKAFDSYDLQKAVDYIWTIIGETDKKIQTEKPFSLIKTDPDTAKSMIKKYIETVYFIAKMLEPILPETAEKIKKSIQENKKPSEPLFSRK